MNAKVDTGYGNSVSLFGQGIANAEQALRGENIMGRISTAAVTAAALLACSGALAQVPEEIAGKIAAMGRVNDPAKTAPLYASLHAKEPYPGVKVERDLRYGENERNTLDLFVPEGGSGTQTVFMFVHGGQFIRGNKHPAGSPFYDNIMLWAARNGMVGVNIEYRLAPQYVWPAVGEDLAAAVRWVKANAATHGADPNRIFLMGHSAGATHVAAYVSHPQFHGSGGSGLVGAIFSSGTYDLTTAGQSEGRKLYFGTDLALLKERSPLPGLMKTSLPFMANSAEFDPPPIAEQFEQLKGAMCESPRGCVRTVFQPRHNHMSQSYAINTADTLLSSQILEFIKTGR
jgi:triacylglycerol lipase